MNARLASGTLVASLLLANVVNAQDAAIADATSADAGIETDAQADAQPSPTAPDAAAPVATLNAVPPKLLHSKPPTFPPEMLESGQHPTVVLKVTVFADGTLGDVVVEHSAGPAFDDAAIVAVREWTFAPASREGRAIASRVGVAVHFELPELAVHSVSSLSAHAQPVPHVHNDPHDHKRDDFAKPASEEELSAHARVHAPLRAEERGPSDLRLDSAILRTTASHDAGDLLKRAPGITIARIEGEAVAQRLMLRGFDADHGQDIELNVDGVPINQPSHIHGQGYADLGFMIPETVRSLRVTEGIYDPRQGDFAVAGSADFELGVEKRGIQLSTGYGSFHTFRELALYAPKDMSTDTFAAAVFKKSRGFGQNRASTQGSAVGQLGLSTGPVHFTLHASVHAARANTANALRRDDIQSGRVDFYDVYPEPTAQAQGAFTQRAQLSARAQYKGQRGENAELLLYFVQSDFRLQNNYTGFAQVSRHNPAWAGRGDLIEQTNLERSVGFKSRYRSSEMRPFSFARTFLEVGVSGRASSIEQTQNLVEAPDNTTWDRRIDAQISAADVGGYLDGDLSLFERVHLRGGVRADLLSFHVADQLANYVPSFRAEEHIPGYRRSAAGLAVGPRASLEVQTLPGLSLLAAYGRGYRSPMALLLDDGEPAPFVTVHSADFGFKYALDEQQHLTVRASGYTTHLSDDVAFEPSEGRAESVGPSKRNGFTLYADTRPLPWLFFALSATYVRATLEKPPYASAEDPSPPFRKGQSLPYVPPVVLRADGSLTRELFKLQAQAVSGRMGLGYSFWSARPLPYGQEAKPVSLVDAELGATYRAATLTLSCFNLLDTEYAALELSYPSSWNPDGFASRVPARHIMAGAPRTLFLSLGVAL